MSERLRETRNIFHVMVKRRLYRGRPCPNSALLTIHQLRPRPPSPEVVTLVVIVILTGSLTPVTIKNVVNIHFINE